MSETQPLEKPEGRASVDYLRKLHQQLVQKDNIIKLLQVQVRDLEGDGPVDGDGEALDRLTSALAEAEDRIAELEASEGTESAAEVAALEARLKDLETEVGEVRRLEAALELRQEELERHKELLRSAEDEAAELTKLRRERDELLARTGKLEGQLGKARERATRATRGPAPAEVTALEHRIADLEAALEIARQRVEELEAGTMSKADEELGLDAFGLMQEVIEALQVLDDLRLELFDEEEALGRIEGFLSGMRDALGLERIPTTGEVFDEAVHAAGRIVYSEEGEHGSVVAEEVAGYRLGGKVIKQAQVTVVRNPYECGGCGALGLKGAAFCHVCGANHR